MKLEKSHFLTKDGLTVDIVVVDDDITRESTVVVDSVVEGEEVSLKVRLEGSVTTMEKVTWS